MDIDLAAPMGAPPAAVLAEVADLPSYPEWHGMVHGVKADGDGWLVDLGAKVGPFTKSMRVRMVRAEGDGDHPGRVRFVRAETDGKEHSHWQLEGEVDPPTGEGPCTLHFRLRYDGTSPLVGLIEPRLRSEVEKSAERLRQRLAAG